MTPTTPCLDAETLAAWVDGGLSRSDAALAEAHVSSCPRCQEIAGLIVTTIPAAVAAETPLWKSLRAGWLVPLTTGVAAVGIWMIAPATPTPTPPPSVAMARLEPAPDPAAAPAAAREGIPQQPGLRRDLEQKKELAGRARPVTKDEAPQVPAETAAEKRRESRENTAVGAAAASAVSAPPAAVSGRLAADESARQSFAPAGVKQAVSPDGALHWRITDRGALGRSTDGGTTWQAVNVGVSATFTTVQAPEPRTAIVTASDGRRFRTTDAGATWQPE